MKMSGICRGSEGVLDETTAPCIVFERIMYHTTVLVRGVCVCAVHLTVNLRSSYDRGKRKILRVHHLMPIPEMMSYAPKKWLRSALLRHQSVT